MPRWFVELYPLLGDDQAPRLAAVGQRIVACRRWECERPRKAVDVPSVRERLTKLGVEPMSMSPPEFDSYFRADVTDTVKLAQEAGIQKQ
jgi:hypothetical protein